MTQEEALANLSNAVKKCQEAGLSVRVVQMYGEMKAPYSIALPDDVRYVSGQLFLSDGRIWSRAEELGYIDR